MEVVPEVKEVRLKDGTMLRYGALIGGDGVNSRVARTLFGQAFDQSMIGFALEVEQPDPASEPLGPARIDFGAAAWGYGWSFPKKETRTIGVGGLHQRNPDLKERLASYIRDLGVSGPTSRVKGHFVPFGTSRKQLGRGSVLVCGDAAGLVDPLTGEGIAYAMKSGQIAAECAAEALAKGEPEVALRLYQRRVAGIRRSIAQARALGTLVYSAGHSGTFEAFVASPRSARSSYMDLLAGETEYPTLIGRKLRQLPRHVFGQAVQAVQARLRAGT